MEGRVGSVAHVFRATFKDLFPEEFPKEPPQPPPEQETQPTDQITDQPPEEPKTPKKSSRSSSISKSSKASKRNSKASTKKDRKSKIKEPEPPPIVEEEKPAEEQPVEEEKPPEQPEEKKLELSQENIEIQNSILNNIQESFSGRVDQLDTMMQELEKRNQEANDHTMNVKKYLKEKGLLLKTDIPLEENEKLTKLAEINGSPGVKRHVVIGTDLIDNYNEKTLYLTGNVELPDNMKVIFGTAKIPPHYLKSTAVIDNHVISRTGILNRTKAKREKEALKKMESLTKNGNQQQLQQTENKTHRPRLLLPVSQVLTGEERDATMKTLREMNAKNNFLKNPRYRNTKLANSHLRQTLATYEQDTSVNGISGQTTLKPQPCYFQRNETGFYAKPEVVLYRDYLKGLQYQQEVFVYNGSSITKRVQILPPKTEFFTIIDIHYPRGYAGNGDIASGMSCKVIVRFMPDEARDYDDAIIVISDSNQFIIPLQARRDPPILTLPSKIDVGACLMGDKIILKQPIINKGGEGHFWMLLDTENYLERRTTEGILRFDSFTIKPTEFSIDHNKDVVCEIRFCPLEVGHHEGKFYICCDHCLVYEYTLVGLCQPVELTWDSVDDIPTIQSITSNKEKNSENDNDDDDSVVLDQEWPIVKNLKTDYVAFTDCIIGDKETHKVTIQSNTYIDLEYQWYLLDENNNFIECDDIELDQVEGVLKANETLDTLITYKPKELKQLHCILSLFIKNIPKESSPTGITFPCGEKYVETVLPSNAPVTRTSMLVKSQKNESNRIELVICRCIDIELKGIPLLLDVTIDKSIIEFHGCIYPNNSYKNEFTLTNNSSASTTFEIDKPYVEPASENSLNDWSIIELNIPSNTIEPEHPVTIAVILKPKENDYGKLDITFPIRIANIKQKEYRLRVKCEITLPQLHFDVPELDFGLLGVDHCNTFKIPISNISNVPIEVYFSAYELHGIFNKENSEDFSEEKETNPDKATIECYPKHYTFKPKEKILIDCKCLAGRLPERMRNSLKIYYNDQKTMQFLPLRAEIQAPEVYLKELSVDFGTIYVGVPVTKILHLKNCSNLDTTYEFHCESCNENNNTETENDEFKYELTPSKGTLTEKQNLEVKLTYTAKKDGYCENLFSCDVGGILYSLGFETKATVRDLMIGYTISDNIPSNSNLELLKPNDILPSELPEIDFGDNLELNKQYTKYLIIGNYSGIKTSYRLYFTTFSEDGLYLKPAVDNMESITGLIRENGVQSTMCVTDPSNHQNINNSNKSSSRIGVVQSLVLNKSTSILNNNSNNNKNKLLKSNEIEPLDNMMPSMSEDSLELHKSFIHTNTNTNCTCTNNTTQKKKKILDNKHEKTNRFISKKGIEYLTTQKIEKHIDKMLSSGQGLVLINTPNEGVLNPWEQIVIQLDCYADIPGTYTDNLVCEIEGINENVMLNVKAKVVGCPLEIVKDCVGLDYSVNPYILNIPNQIVNSGEYKKGIKIRNLGPYDIMVSFRQRNLMSEKENYFNIHCLPNMNRNEVDVYYKLSFDRNEKRFIESPFIITPEQEIIPSHCTREFVITFPGSEVESVYDCLVMIDGEWIINKKQNSVTSSVRRPKLENCLSFGIKANVLYPKLSIDKTKLNIKIWSIKSNNDPSFTKYLCLTNKTSNEITFSLETSKPFDIVEVSNKSIFDHPSVQSNEYFSDKKLVYKLDIKSNLECGIKYNASKRFRNETFKTLVNTSKSSIPILSNIINGNLRVTYNNGSIQDIPIECEELHPMLMIKPVEYNFNVVNTSEMKSTKLILMNPSEVDVIWSISHQSNNNNNNNNNVVDDASVFHFSETEGVIKGPCYSIESREGYQPNEIEWPEKMPFMLTVDFHPKKNVFYESRFRFTVEEAESVDIILRGYGSYEDEDI